MRVKLKKGYQEKLILLAKFKRNLTWKKLAEEIGIVENYLKNEIKNEKRTVSLDTYNNLKKIAEVNFDKYIIEKLDNNWGKSKGGLNSGEAKLLLKKPSLELAELVGIILGLIFLFVFLSHHKRNFGIHLV